MAIEKLFFEIKQDILLESSRLSAEAIKLMREGDTQAGETKFDEAKQVALRTRTVDEVLPTILERFSAAGITQPPAGFLRRVLDEVSISPPTSPASSLEPRPHITVSRRPKSTAESRPISPDELERSPLAALITSKTRLHMLRVFFQNPEEPLHVREIARRIDDTGINGVRRELENLGTFNIVTDHWQENRRYYQLNPDSPIFPSFSQLYSQIPPQEVKPEQNKPSIEEDPNINIDQNSQTDTNLTQTRLILPDTLRSSPDEPANLIERYLATADCLTLFEILQKSQVTSPADYEKFKKALVGHVFEALGYIYLKDRDQKGNTFVLSPDETFRFFNRLHPEKKVIHNYQLNSGIKGLNFPDGLVLKTIDDRLSLEAVIDYKASVKELHYDPNVKNQFASYNPYDVTKDLIRFDHTSSSGAINIASNLLHEIRPDLPANDLTLSQNYRIIAAVPTNSAMIGGIIDRTQIERIPLHSYDLATFVTLLLTSNNVSEPAVSGKRP